MTAPFTATGPELRPEHFTRVAELLRHVAGIDLRAGKEGLVRSRLAARFRALGIDSFDAYFAYLEADASGAELVQMVDVLTTNKTSFFREAEHFRFLREEILPPLAERRAPVRIWSAGCSSGEEPYTTAIVLRETLDAARLSDARILATDISTRVLARAREGVYAEELLADVPPQLAKRHFEPVAGASGALTLAGTPARRVRVVEQTRALVRFARLNLMGEWPMKGPFDLIMCRNVMIYFDKPTQERLVRRYASLLAPGGHLFVGHSESLGSIRHELQYVQPAVYRR